jgi:hypothetical protein
VLDAEQARPGGLELAHLIGRERLALVSPAEELAATLLCGWPLITVRSSLEPSSTPDDCGRSCCSFSMPVRTEGAQLARTSLAPMRSSSPRDLASGAARQGWTRRVRSRAQSQSWGRRLGL